MQALLLEVDVSLQLERLGCVWAIQRDLVLSPNMNPSLSWSRFPAHTPSDKLRSQCRCIRRSL